MKSGVCGLDEAGRGALAGPLVAAAVKFLRPTNDTNLRDGKLLNPKSRRLIYRKYRKYCEILVEVISARSINNHGIGWANREIFRRLIKKVEAEEYIVDGNLKIVVRGKTPKIRSLVDADALIPEAILAGIVAKVERDRIMCSLHRDWPQFHWRINKGYGTPRHLSALARFGSSSQHRDVFVQTAINGPKKPPRYRLSIK